MRKSLSLFIQNNKGVTAIEYAIVGVAIAAIVAAVMSNPTLENSLSGAISEIATIINSV
ncbi:Flp family type IVb pilin [Marinomonas sp. 15G1-11]|uniref:Flp family type IVb pilin n=1 Tax=Marinomonas phaeophyticola TaxID=3004091 RepID=A0ABT4JTC0_9GAMM|nr:Flp family type IVb pilin [Marinomonas sp. 15G1-11]MCZ2721629.1 Flp family type IVb pilin [Marinomonas sp. 15G1-11]